MTIIIKAPIGESSILAPSNVNSSIMKPLHLVFILVAALLAPKSVAKDTNPRGHLPKCEFDTETQFYNVDIDVLELPEICNDSNLIDIGLLIQTVVDEVEARMPDYREEYMTTQVCPFPDEVNERRRRKLQQKSSRPPPPDRLDNEHRKLATPPPTPKKRRRYTFRGTGRCRRCKNKTTARFLLQSMHDVCTLAKQTSVLQEQSRYAVTTSLAIQENMKEKANDKVFEKVDLGDLIWQANEYASDCLQEAQDTSRAAKSVTKLCLVSSRLRTPAALLAQKVEDELSKAVAATARAKGALAQMRTIQFDMNTLYHKLDSQQHRELKKKKQKSQPSPAPSPFGIEDLILVDAKRDKDIVVIGSKDCEPLNRCFGSATRFNIRAETFGDIDSVYLTSEGPIREPGRTEGISPYTVWGDDGHGDYNQEELVPGTYTITARATDTRGNKSPTFKKTFTIESGDDTEQSSGSLASFGIQDLILVDAIRDRDIVAIGSTDCEPLNKCFDSATSFNIRAETFGDVDSVYLTSEGPIREPGRNEGIPPYSVWGDDGYGNYYRNNLAPGTYTVTARATDRSGNKSTTFTRTFTVDTSNIESGRDSSTTSFGIEDLILVDAKEDKDIVAIGSPDCEPLNKCFGSATRFNIRAKTFGRVDSVYLTSEGPIREPGRREGIAPYAVWGDDGNGDYYQEELVPGTYTVSARAKNRRGDESSTYTKTFTVVSSSEMAALSAPAPTPVPTNAPTSLPTGAPTVSPTSSPTVVPTESPTGLPTASPTASPTEGPTASPTGEPTESPTTLPSSAPTTSPTASPTRGPTVSPTVTPTRLPTVVPTALPTRGPTGSPTLTPTLPATALPTLRPTESPTVVPTAVPTVLPTAVPTRVPTVSPTSLPTTIPTASLTAEPTGGPTASPTASPTAFPTTLPTSSPTGKPTNVPTALETSDPTTSPTSAPLSIAPVAVLNAPPQDDYALMPSAAPSSNFVKLLARSGEDFVNRFATNLAASNTECGEVKQAMIQKTLAEETGIAGDEVYDEINALARGYERNTNIVRIKSVAEKAHSDVQDKAAKACAAADLASELCRDSNGRRLENAELIQEEVDIAAEAVLQSRLALSKAKAARNEMEETVALIEFDPKMSQLETKKAEDEAALVEHLDTVVAAISEVDSKIKTLPEDSPELPVLAKKRDYLVEEEMQIEEALVNEEQFDISQSALKKDQFYQSVAPDFQESPPLQYIQTSSTPEIKLAGNSSLLQYILRTRTDQDHTTKEANWNAKDETAGSKAEWFRRFGDMLVADVQTRLFLVYNTDVGGCIPEDSALSIVVVVTELGTIWEQFGVPMCSTEFLARGPGRQKETRTADSEQFIGIAALVPSVHPSDTLSMVPSNRPSSFPSDQPSTEPSNAFTNSPSSVPSESPSDTRSNPPSSIPSNTPFSEETKSPSVSPSGSSEGIPESLDGVIIYNDGTSGTIRRNIFNEDSGSFGDSREIAKTGSTKWRYMRGASSPTRNEKILTSINTDADLHAWMCTDEQCHGTGTWTEIPISPLGTNLVEYFRPHANVAYESISGVAMLVWGNVGDGLRYSRWNGENWSNVKEVSAYSGDKAMWIEMASNPRSNEITVVVTDSKDDDYILVWSGADWYSPFSESIDTTGNGSHHATATSVAYESSTGTAIVVYEEAGYGDERRLYYRLSSAWSTKKVLQPPPRVAGNVYWTELASNPHPDSNQIVLGVQTSEREFWVCVWKGGFWELPIKAWADTWATYVPNVAVAFESDSGPDGRAVAAFGSPPHSRSWTNGEWSDEVQVATYLANTLTLYPHPTTNEIMMAVLDQKAPYGLHCVLWNGSEWTLDVIVTDANNDFKNQPFMFLWDQPSNLFSSSEATPNGAVMVSQQSLDSTLSSTSRPPTSSPSKAIPCGNDVCTDICAAACVKYDGTAKFGTYVQEYAGLTVQCCISQDNGDIKDQCNDNESGMLGKNRYNGVGFGEADIDVLCCVGKESCRKSIISIPANGICCRSPLFNKDSLMREDHDKTCGDAEFIASSSSKTSVYCQGQQACSKSIWSDEGSNVELCCAGDEVCVNLEMDGNTDVTPIFVPMVPIKTPVIVTPTPAPTRRYYDSRD